MKTFNRIINGCKVCSQCQVNKPLTDYSPRNAKAGDTLPRGKCKNCSSEYVIARRDPSYHRQARFRREYGITLDDYDVLVEAQQNRCAICLTTPKKQLFVDHDHQTGNVRGLLCFHCNSGLGHFRDSVSHLHRAAQYLTDTSLTQTSEGNAHE